jgi:murein DD-endopeptidase / murein LD-carboxypeptidase
MFVTRKIVQVGLIALLSFWMLACTHRKKTHLPSKAYKAEELVIIKKYAEKLAVAESEIKNPKLYTFINDWYAAPYQYGGKTKSGIDCSGLMIRLYKEVYQSDICCTSQTLFQQVNVINKEELKEGDLIFFKINSSNISHIGMYLMNNKFVHASSSKGVIISDLKEAYYQKYYYKSGRVKQSITG